MLRLSRIVALAIKELSVALLDKRARTTLIIGPLVQAVVFGLATTLDVTGYSVGYVNRDNGIASERLLAALAASPDVRAITRFDDTAQQDEALDRGRIIAGLVIPPDLSRRVAGGQTGDIGLILDGRRIASAQIVAGYMTVIARQTGIELRPRGGAPAPQIVRNNWWNPNLDYRWFTMPALVMLLVTISVLSISVHAVAREREMGTYDQMMVLPLTRVEILLGKLAPGVTVGLVNGLAFAWVIPWLFGVPMRGSGLLLLVAIVVQALAVTGIGLTITCLTRTQQQAFLTAFLIIVPIIFLSGYASPVDNMPLWLRHLAEVDPLRHMLVIADGLFLKDLPASIVFDHLWPMLLLALATLTTATMLFRVRID